MHWALQDEACDIMSSIHCFVDLLPAFDVGLRCHIGLGANKAEHCKAELLLQPCQDRVLCLRV